MLARARTTSLFPPICFSMTSGGGTRFNVHVNCSWVLCSWRWFIKFHCNSKFYGGRSLFSASTNICCTKSPPCPIPNTIDRLSTTAIYRIYKVLFDVLRDIFLRLVPLGASSSNQLQRIKRLFFFVLPSSPWHFFVSTTLASSPSPTFSTLIVLIGASRK